MQDFDEKLFEDLASVEHQIWSDWQSWLHGLCKENDDGSLTIPKDKVLRWNRQIHTNYKDLSEEEKRSDREQVKKYWQLIMLWQQKRRGVVGIDGT